MAGDPGRRNTYPDGELYGRQSGNILYRKGRFSHPNAGTHGHADSHADSDTDLYACADGYPGADIRSDTHTQAEEGPENRGRCAAGAVAGADPGRTDWSWRNASLEGKETKMINVVLSAGTICFVQFGEYRMAEQRDDPFCSQSPCSKRVVPLFQKEDASDRADYLSGY